MAPLDDEDDETPYVKLPHPNAPSPAQPNQTHQRNPHSQLSASTLSALQSFLSERDSRNEQFESLRTASESAHAARSSAAPLLLSMSAFAEDWNASQFWYSPATAASLASQLLAGATASSAIAFVSAPSAFIAARNLLASDPRWAAAEGAEGAEAPPSRPRLALLEFDERFALFPEFARYDYNAPVRLPGELRGAFDAIVCDPPFLSEECQTKAAVTVRWLAKGWSKEEVRLVVCTGERMEGLMGRLYGKVGVRTTDFEVVHQKGLSNEFRCYANWETDEWRFKEES
jgi:hypothetical protein